jgi:tRNA (cytidine32/uridine32-2'-O)-methyltransferase
VLAYEIRRCASELSDLPPKEPARDVATADEMEGFYGHLEKTLAVIDFSGPEQSKTLMKRLRRLFNRARPDRVELNILRGILRAAQGRRPPEPGTNTDRPTLVRTPPSET